MWPRPRSCWRARWASTSPRGLQDFLHRCLRCALAPRVIHTNLRARLRQCQRNFLADVPPAAAYDCCLPVQVAHTGPSHKNRVTVVPIPVGIIEGGASRAWTPLVAAAFLSLFSPPRPCARPAAGDRFRGCQPRSRRQAPRARVERVRTGPLLRGDLRHDDGGKVTSLKGAADVAVPIAGARTAVVLRAISQPR